MRNFNIRNGRPYCPALTWREHRRARAREPHRQRDHGEERREQDQSGRRDDDVHRALQEERRAAGVPGVVFDDGQLGDMSEVNGRPEHAAGGRNDAQPRLLLAAHGDQARDQRFVKGVGGEDHSVDVVQLAVQRLDVVQGELSAIAEHVDVNVRKELELPPRRIRERSIAEDDGARGRRHRTPQQSRRSPQGQPGAEGHGPRNHGAHRRETAGRSGVEEERQRGSASQRPEKDALQLVRRDVAQRLVIAIVEPEELREEDPNGDEERRPRGGCEAGSPRSRAPRSRSARQGRRRPRACGAGVVPGRTRARVEGRAVLDEATCPLPAILNEL